MDYDDIVLMWLLMFSQWKRGFILTILKFNSCFNRTPTLLPTNAKKPTIAKTQPVFTVSPF